MKYIITVKKSKDHGDQYHEVSTMFDNRIYAQAYRFSEPGQKENSFDGIKNTLTALHFLGDSILDEKGDILGYKIPIDFDQEAKGKELEFEIQDETT